MNIKRENLNLCVYGLTRDIKDELTARYKSIFWIADDVEADIQPNKLNIGCVSDCTIQSNHTMFYKFVYKEIGDFIRLNSRHSYIKNKSYLYYEILLYKMCRYLCGKSNQREIDFIVFGNLPHEGFDWVVLKFAEFKLIPYICLYQTIFPDKFIAWDKSIKPEPVSGAGIKDAFNKFEPFYMKGESNWFFKKIKRFMSSEGKYVKILSILKNLMYFLERKVITSSRTLRKVPDYDFIYFPLHLQPELTTSVFGYAYHNQILAVQELREKIDSNTIILIKENPKQNMRNRSPDFYKELLRIEGVYFIDVSVSSLELIKRSLAVASICGTAGFEALCEGKPAIYFGDAWYKNFKGAIHITEYSSLGHFAPNSEEDVHSFKKYALNGVVDPMYYCISELNYERSVYQTCDSIDLAIKVLI